MADQSRRLNTFTARTTCEAYKGYLVRWSEFTIVRDGASHWVEKDSHFICWADSIADAKQKIDEVTR